MLNTFLDGLAELGVDTEAFDRKQEDFEQITKKRKRLIERTVKVKVMMPVTVATVATARKVNQKAMIEKVTMSLTKKESLRKSPWNHGIIVKVGISPRLLWLSAPDAFEISICPICGYDIPVDNEHIKEAFARCNDCGATYHENMKTLKVSLYLPSEDQDWIYSSYC